MTAPADQPHRPVTGPPPGWAYRPREEPPPADQAVCTPADADRLLYSGSGSGSRNDALIDDARRLCQSCPVQVECLDYALTVDERDGMWGGCTESERWVLRRNLGLRAIPRRTEPLQLCGTPAAHRRHLRAGEEPCEACREANTLRKALKNYPGRVLLEATA